MPGKFMNTTALGFYGKVPTKGDFVSRRLPQDFINVWSDWHQAGIQASQEQLGEMWSTIALTSPIWRFCISPGPLGANAWAGVMMPSMDKVGRYYPLTLAHIIQPELQQCLVLSSTQWFEQLENLALSALADDFDFEYFDQQLKQTHFDANLLGLQDNATEPVASFSDFAEELAKMGSVHLLTDLTDANPTYSYWASQNAHYQKTYLIFSEGLPDKKYYPSFLTENWTQIEASQCRLSDRTDIDDCENTLPYAVIAKNNANQVIWQSYAITDTGKKRKHNEDAMLNKPEAGLWVVADGMGGHQAGDLASRLVVDGLAELENSDSLNEQIDSLSKRLEKLNTDLRAYAQTIEAGSIIGTTVVALLAKGLQCAAVWAGDSRLYRYRGGQLQQLTRDHTKVNELIESGMPKEEAEQHTGVNVITRAVGGHENLHLENMCFAAELDDRYLLCSDGLDKELTDEDIATVMAETECRQVGEKLMAKALSQAARDNITVIVCQVSTTQLM